MPTVYSGTNTALYLYYDSSKSDNTTYVGDSGENAAALVWDGDFVAVYHMSQIPLGAGSIVNSKSGAHNGTPTGYDVLTNVALSKTCAQYTEGSGYPAGNAVDNNTSSFQSTASAATGLWWKVDLGAVYTITSVQMYKRSGYGTRPNYYYIQTSDDWAFTSNVINIITENNETSAGSWITWDTTDFGTVSSRYFRVYTHTSAQYINISEFRVNILGDSLVAGKIGDGMNFDGGAEISLGIDVALDLTSAFTYEAIFKSSTAATQDIIAKFDETGTDYQMELHINSTGSVSSNIYNGVLTGANCNTDHGLGGNYTDDNYHYAVTNIDVVSGDGKSRLFMDGNLNVTSSGSLTDINSLFSVPTIMGERYNSSTDKHMTGILDEVRISIIKRIDAWIKATYYSNWDELVIFGAEQGTPTHYNYGYVTEDGAPISRMVRLYCRDTGELMDTTTSSGNDGYYYLTTNVDEEHFIIAFDDVGDKDYNALILDRLLPRGIE